MRTSTAAMTVWLLVLPGLGQEPAGQQGQPQAAGAPADARDSEVLNYRVEWRLIHAGNATLAVTAPRGDGTLRDARLHLESAGLVSRLYKVNDEYSVQLEEGFCARSVLFKAEEGKRRRETTITVDRTAGKTSYLERDLVKNTSNTKELEVPSCVHDVLGGLMRLRSLKLEPGQTVQMPITDGKKFVQARVDAQEREQIRTPAGLHKTVRHEAHLFNGVLYGRKGRLYIWLTDDEARTPVQIRVRLQFHVGTITFQLEKKEEKS